MSRPRKALDDDGCLTGAALDDAGEIVASVPFEYPAEPDALELDADAERRLRIETIVRLLQFLTAQCRSPKKAGRRVHLLAYLCGASEAKTQKQLARRLGVTPGAISAKLKPLKAILRTLGEEL